MPDVGYLAALVAGGVGVSWWRFLKMRPRRAPEALYAPDAEIAMHVARHEARTRNQPLSALHVVNGLLQDEVFAGAIGKLGGDVQRIEDKVFAELDSALAARSGAEIGEILNHAVVVARHNGRLATCTDLWAYIAASPAAKVVEAGAVEPVALLYTLVHGDVEAAPSAMLMHREADVVVRNDDYTTRDFVVALLREVFGLAEPDAITRMAAAHDRGSAVVGRYAGDTARAKVTEARARARAQGFPLRIDIEPR